MYHTSPALSMFFSFRPGISRLLSKKNLRISPFFFHPSLIKYACERKTERMLPEDLDTSGFSPFSDVYTLLFILYPLDPVRRPLSPDGV